MSTPSERKRKIDLSGPQIVGGAVAAATAATLSTRLGLVGTISGAVLMSIVSTVVAASMSGWLGGLRERLVRRDAPRWAGALAGTAALALVAFAFHTGLDLATSDLPRDTFAARLLAEMGLAR